MNAIAVHTFDYFIPTSIVTGLSVIACDLVAANDNTCDANGDSRIDPLDVDTVLSVILQTGSAAGNADCNSDGIINVLDITCINNLITTKTPTNPASAKLRYAYDEGARQLGEYDDAGKPITETIWLGNLPIAMRQSDKTYYIYTDQLNTPRVITDSTNTPLWHWDNADPFGATLPNEDPDGNGLTLTYNLRFAGQTYDRETGLHYNVNRYYDPKTGRYETSDPIGIAGGLNTYGYVGGNPANLVDPLGLEASWSDTGRAYVNLILIDQFLPFVRLSNPNIGLAYDDPQFGGNVELGYVATEAVVGCAALARGLYKGLMNRRVLSSVVKEIPPIKPGTANGSTAGQAFPQRIKDAAKAENPTATCVYCRMEGTGKQVDHAIPRARGGDATLDNAQLACPHCNASKGAGDFPKSPPADYVGPWPPTYW